VKLEFIKAGLQTSIQDQGRKGLMHLGISASGAMDQRAMLMANWLLGNQPNSPIIEITQLGPIIRCHGELKVAICGAEFELQLNQQPVASHQVIKLHDQDILSFNRLKQGARAYLAFCGELEIAKQLGSYSTHITAGYGGFKDRQLVDGDELFIQQRALKVTRKLKSKSFPQYSGNYLIRCVNSVETTLFTQIQREYFFSQSFRVSSMSNRMGVRLEGQPVTLHKPIEIISTGLVQGSVQVPPSGLPIISSVDGQTIGGYPRIAGVISSDLSLLGQLKAGDKIRFTLVDLDFAYQSLARDH
jgi:biotin-dependent carboxylase-like uncharacterized protein